jgi:hypothetical protein
LVFSLLTNLGVSLHKVVLLFLSFSKSPSLLKIMFECKRYRIFCMSVFAVLQFRCEIRSCSGLSSGDVLALEYSPELLWARPEQHLEPLRAAPGKPERLVFYVAIKGGFFPNGYLRF